MKQKRIKKRHPMAVVFIIICIAAIATAGFFVLNGSDSSFGNPAKPAAAPVVLEGTLRAMVINKGALDFVTGEAAREKHEEALAAVITHAKEQGYNAILYQIAQGDEYYARLNDKTPAQYIADCDKFLNKWDPLDYFTRQASAQGVAVFALYDGSETAQPDAQVIKQVESKYSVSGTYVNNHGIYAGESTLSAVYEGDVGELYTPTATIDVYGIELLANAQDFGGFMYETYGEQPNKDLQPLLETAFNFLAKPEPLGYVGTPTLNLTYPQSKTAKVYSSKVFIMGTSDPTQPLTLNDTEVQRTSSLGSFGVLVELKKGVNNYTLAQGNTKIDFTINRATATGGGGGTIKADGSVEAKKGQRVEITAAIASGLHDVSSDAKMSVTFKRGGTAVVTESVRTTRNGKKTWAYKLGTGDYVLANNSKILADNVTPNFTGGTAVAGEFGEVITLAGAGTPMAYTAFENNVLTIRFADTTIDSAFNITGSEFVQGVTVGASTGTTDIALQMGDKKLWGWDIRYVDGSTQIFLKYAPQKTVGAGKLPLQGVRVMLDPGHGEDDIGAMAVDGTAAPCEKDVNLSVAEATKYYLERMGATVIMTRTDDTFRTLEERLYEQFTQTPDFFLSIHHNSIELVVDANNAKGTECYYFYEGHKEFATQLSLNVSKNAERENRGEKYGYFYVTRSTVSPSNLLEVGFMVNPLEYSAIIDQSIIDKTGAGIATSVYNLVP